MSTPSPSSGGVARAEEEPPAEVIVVQEEQDAQAPGTATTTPVDLTRVVTWDDITAPEDAEKKPTGVMGMTWKQLSSKQLRTICSQLAIRSVKNAKKQEMVDKICGVYANKKVMLALQEQQQDGGSSASLAKTRKEVQCSFRIINIIFSDAFADEFATLGNVATRQLLDSGGAANDEHFWVRVHAAFLEPHPDYDELDFMSSDDVFSAQDHIDPGKIVKHNWKKLRSIWKGVNADYKAAYAKYTVSGTHDQSFYNFCNGKLDVYYLRKKLDQRPQLHETVNADLPEECAVSSDMKIQESSASSKRGGGGGAAKNTMVRGSSDGAGAVASAIRDFAASKMQSELAKHKVTFMVEEATRRRNEEGRRQNEEVRRQQEYEWTNRKVKFEEWEKIQENLRNLRSELRRPDLDEDERRDLKVDCNRLKKMKNELALKMGLDDE
jgi:hypothetical protein